MFHPVVGRAAAAGDPDGTRTPSGSRRGWCQGLSAGSEAVLATLQHVDARRGGVRRYLLDHGVSTELVEAIRPRLAELARSPDSDSDGL